MPDCRYLKTSTQYSGPQPFKAKNCTGPVLKGAGCKNTHYGYDSNDAKAKEKCEYYTEFKASKKFS
jgi:hypothetical protein